MPIAFFTRTRTGALVSRLNNDVIGAQRAFSDTLSGVVGNLVDAGADARRDARHLLADHAAGAAAAAGLRAAGAADGQPAGPAGAGGGRPQRGDEHPDDRAVLRARRDAGQAVRPAGARSRPSSRARARRVRDIGVRTAMVQWVFITALTLVSALALALVYGLGGFFALRGQLDPGAVVALALLLTRLYAPLTALASARVEVMSALVSFERVFEVLDLQAADRRAAGRRGRCPTGRCRWSSTTCASATRRRTRCRWPRWRRSRTLDTRGGVEVLHGVSFRAEPGQMVALVGSSGAGQVDDRAAGAAALRRRRRRGAAVRCGRARPVVRLDPRDARAW